jgi:hypothetical protein
MLHYCSRLSEGGRGVFVKVHGASNLNLKPPRQPRAAFNFRSATKAHPKKNLDFFENQKQTFQCRGESKLLAPGPESAFVGNINTIFPAEARPLGLKQTPPELGIMTWEQTLEVQLDGLQGLKRASCLPP